jgi:type IV secretory pathway VirB4 component
VVQEPNAAQIGRMANCIYAMILSTRKSGEIVEAKDRNLIALVISVAFAQARKHEERAVYMTNFLHLMEESYREESKGIIESIRPFTRGQPLGRWFDGPTTVDLDSKVILFDLTGIRTNKPLAGAMVPLLTNYIHDLVMRDPGVTKIIPMDELWELILNPQLMELVIESVKAWRKMGAIVIGCTQSLFDLEKNPHVASAIKQNTDTWLLMDQGNGDEPQFAKDFLELTIGQYDILTTLGRANRITPEGELEVYREMLMIRGHGPTGTSGRVRVGMSPIDYWLATTKPKEIQLRSEARTMFKGDLRLAIDYLATKYPGGTELSAAA